MNQRVSQQQQQIGFEMLKTRQKKKKKKKKKREKKKDKGKEFRINAYTAEMNKYINQEM